MSLFLIITYTLCFIIKNDVHNSFCNMNKNDMFVCCKYVMTNYMYMFNDIYAIF